MFRFAILFLILVISIAPTAAGEWPTTAKGRMNAAGDRLRAATTTTQRVKALREIEAIAAAYPNASGARITAMLIGKQATMEAGPRAMLGALGELTASGQIKDVNSYARIIGPLMETLVKMHKDDTLLSESAILLDDALKKLDSAAAKAGLPSIADAISKATGNNKLGAAVTSTLGRVASIAKAARESPNVAEMNKQETKEYIENVMSIFPPGGGPAINGPAFVAVRDNLAWNNEMFGQSTKVLNLVADAIETGKFDHSAYNKIRNRIKELGKKGPWDSDTVKDFFKKLCEKIPVAGAWCDDAFKLGERLASKIRVSSATYGRNCGVSRGNVTAHIARQCNGRSECRYTVNYKIIGDPVYGCAKTYAVEYRCGNNPQAQRKFLSPEAGWGNKSVFLVCP